MRASIRSSRLVAALMLAGVLGGCAAQDLQQLQAARDQTAAALAQAQAAHDQIQQQLTTLPAADPVRQQLEPRLTQLDQIITKAQSFLPLLDAGIKSAQTPGQIDPTLQQAVGVIPYGSLALAAVSLIFGVVKHVQAGNLLTQNDQTQKAFQQVVAALDAVAPSPSPEQQAKVNAVLDTDVKAQVAATRAS